MKSRNSVHLKWHGSATLVNSNGYRDWLPFIFHYYLHSLISTYCHLSLTLVPLSLVRRTMAGGRGIWGGGRRNLKFWLGLEVKYPPQSPPNLLFSKSYLCRIHIGIVDEENSLIMIFIIMQVSLIKYECFLNYYL